MERALASISGKNRPLKWLPDLCKDAKMCYNYYRSISFLRFGGDAANRVHFTGDYEGRGKEMRFKKKIVMVLVLILMVAAGAPAFAAYDMPYYIGVDITNQIVTIYRTEDNAIVRQMLCSSGMNDCTPEGTFYLTEKGRLSERGEWTWLSDYQSWVKFATRIYHGYMFHSLPFSEKDESTMIEESAKKLGIPDSHGCIRLRVDDARFIAKECLQGTMVKIYRADEKDEDLRQLLLVSSYTGEDGMSYYEFLGYSENALGNGSSGSDVVDLQHRLTDLGYYGGEAHGSYDAATVAAVKRLQADLGVAQNGISTPELLEVIYSESAPVSTGEIDLQEGRSGPVVKKFQSALATLGFYSGELDSVYDVDVREAVSAFQGACGYPVDGVASAEIQQAAYYLVNELENTFGAGAIPQPQEVQEEVDMATLESKANIIIRSSPSTDSQNLGKLRNGDIVMLNGVEGEWASITAESINGYVLKKYLKPFTQENVMIRFDNGSGTVYQIGHTKDEYRAGAQSVADTFSSYYTSGQYSSGAMETVDYVTVRTGSDDVKLNLRSEADSQAQILAEIPNGTQLRVLEEVEGWTRVGYDDQIGYLMNDYLDFWQGSADDVQSTQIEEQSYASQLQLEDGQSNIQAVVICPSDQEGAPVYDVGSEDGVVLGSLPAGTHVQVVQVGVTDDWVRIRYEEKEGFMMDANLQFELIQ